MAVHVVKSRILHTTNETAIRCFEAVEQCSLGLSVRFPFKFNKLYHKRIRVVFVKYFSKCVLKNVRILPYREQYS